MIIKSMHSYRPILLDYNLFFLPVSPLAFDSSVGDHAVIFVLLLLAMVPGWVGTQYLVKYWVFKILHI